MADNSKKTIKVPGPLFILLGAGFGFLLSRAGATTYDFYAQLFLFEDLQLMWVIAVAAGIGVIGNLIFKAVKAKSPLSGQVLEYKPKGMKRSLVPGSLIFGLGWGLAGACPGTALAMLGEGKLGSIFTIVGMILGTALYGILAPRLSKAK